MFRNINNHKVIVKQHQINYKKWKGSMVVEASYLMPFTMILYGVIILIAAVLLRRCLSSQNQFLYVYQMERYTGSGRSEVIYADWGK